MILKREGLEKDNLKRKHLETDDYGKEQSEKGQH